MSIFMALTGTENPTLRLVAMMFSLGLLAMAVASGRVELVALHSALCGLHVRRIMAAQTGLGGPVLARA